MTELAGPRKVRVDVASVFLSGSCTLQINAGEEGVAEIAGGFRYHFLYVCRFMLCVFVGTSRQQVMQAALVRVRLRKLSLLIP